MKNKVGNRRQRCSTNASSTSTARCVDPLKPNDHAVVNPATKQPVAVITMGTTADIDRAVAAARKAFAT